MKITAAIVTLFVVMSTGFASSNPAVQFSIRDDSIKVILQDGRLIALPLEFYFDLDDATVEELQDVSLVDDGHRVYFHALGREIRLEDLASENYSTHEIECGTFFWSSATLDDVDYLSEKWGEEFLTHRCGEDDDSSFLQLAVKANSSSEVIQVLQNYGFSIVAENRTTPIPPNRVNEGSFSQKDDFDDFDLDTDLPPELGQEEDHPNLLEGRISYNGFNHYWEKNSNPIQKYTSRGIVGSNIFGSYNLTDKVRVAGSVRLGQPFHDEWADGFNIERFVSELYVDLKNIELPGGKKIRARIGKQPIIMSSGYSAGFVLGSANNWFNTRIRPASLGVRLEFKDLMPQKLKLDRFELMLFESDEYILSSYHFDPLIRQLKPYFSLGEIQNRFSEIFQYGKDSGYDPAVVNYELSQAFPGRDFSALSQSMKFLVNLYDPINHDLDQAFAPNYPDWGFDGGMAVALSAEKKIGKSGVSALLSLATNRNTHLATGRSYVGIAGLTYVTRDRRLRTWLELIHNKNDNTFILTDTKNGFTSGFIWTPSEKWIVSSELSFGEKHWLQSIATGSYLLSPNVIVTAEMSNSKIFDKVLEFSKIGNNPPLLASSRTYSLQLSYIFGKRGWLERLFSRNSRRLDGVPE